MKLRAAVHRVQDRIARSLGRAPEDRDALVQQMLRPRDGDATGYWLQLAIATILATLGLALSSTAVVIGAMLIAPLMTPLVELSMGLATGSTPLALRALGRTVASVGFVIAVAIAVTYLLPFHELTTELEARTGPSLLDLVVAGACALAAAYATLRAGAEIATTAAGTSIGISLVPPLCAAGYGIALQDDSVASGAALLFTANLSGILAIATAIFVLAGFGRVAMTAVDVTATSRAPWSTERLGQAWSRRAVPTLGPFARLVPPLALLALVYVPLHRAVGEIKHRGQVRQAVVELLEGEKQRIVRYTIDHDARGVSVRAVVVGDPSTASELDRELRTRLAGVGAANPRISVWAVPDAGMVSALAHRVDELPPPVTPEPAPATAHRYSSELARQIRDVWPQSGTGALLAAWLDLERPTHVHVAHLGAPLGAAGVQLLARALAPAAGAIEIAEDPLVPVEADAGAGARWLPAALALVARTRAFEAIHLCVTLAAPGRRADPVTAVVHDAMTATIEGRDATLVEGTRWSVVPQLEPCPTGPPGTSRHADTTGRPSSGSP